MAKKKGDRKPKTYCSIAVWMQRNREDLWDALEASCNQNVFHGRRRVMTFVCPDKKGEDALVDLAMEEGEKVREVVNTHIVYGCFLKGSEWKAASDEGNLGTYAGLPLTVKGFTDSTVTLSNDTVLKRDAKFKPMGDVRHAVWHVDSGAMPAGTGDFRYTRKSVKGGDAGPSSAVADNKEGRMAIWNDCTAKGPACALRCGAGLLNYLFVSRRDVYDRVCATFGAVAHCPAATLYFLLEPYKASGPYLVPWSNALDIWAGSPEQCVSPLTEYLKHLACSHARTADARRAYASALAGAIEGPGLRAAASFPSDPAGAWRTQLDFLCTYCYCAGDMAALNSYCFTRPGNNYVAEAPLSSPAGSMTDGGADASLRQFALSFIHDVDPTHTALAYSGGAEDFTPLSLGGDEVIYYGAMAEKAGAEYSAVNGGASEDAKAHVLSALKDGALSTLESL